MERDGLVLLLGSGHCPTIKNEVDNLSFLVQRRSPIGLEWKISFLVIQPHLISCRAPPYTHTHTNNFQIISNTPSSVPRDELLRLSFTTSFGWWALTFWFWCCRRCHYLLLVDTSLARRFRVYFLLNLGFSLHVDNTRPNSCTSEFVGVTQGIIGCVKRSLDGSVDHHGRSNNVERCGFWYCWYCLIPVARRRWLSGWRKECSASSNFWWWQSEKK